MKLEENITLTLSKEHIERAIKDFLSNNGYGLKHLAFVVTQRGELSNAIATVERKEKNLKI